MALLTLQNIFQKRSLQWNALIWLYKKTTKKFMSYKFYLIIHLYQSGLFKTFLSNKKTIAYILEICVITSKKKMKCVIDTFHSPKWIFLSYIFYRCDNCNAKQTDHKSREVQRRNSWRHNFLLSGHYDRQLLRGGLFCTL